MEDRVRISRRRNGGRGQAPAAGNVFVITPYLKGRTWMFDDPAKNLKEEPFVKGVPAILRALVIDIPKAKNGFRLSFSAKSFPGHHLVAERGIVQDGGIWYRARGSNRSGWLCPALFKYFARPPRRIYVKVGPIRNGRGKRPRLQEGRCGGCCAMSMKKRISDSGGRR